MIILQNLSHITDIFYGDGSFSLHAANLEYGTVGIRLGPDSRHRSTMGWFSENLCS